jgi:hypothetical protein
MTENRSSAGETVRLDSDVEGAEMQAQLSERATEVENGRQQGMLFGISTKISRAAAMQAGRNKSGGLVVLVAIGKGTRPDVKIGRS